MSDSNTSNDVSSPKEVDRTMSMTNPSRLPVDDPPALPLLYPIFERGGGGGSKAYPLDELDDDDDDDDVELPPP
jgi:hypothetical protein